jgi:hypothetical protein
MKEEGEDERSRENEGQKNVVFMQRLTQILFLLELCHFDAFDQ